MLSLGTYRELRWHAMHRRETSGEGRAGVLAMVLAMAWLAPAPRGVWSSYPRSPDKRRGNRGLRGPVRADNRSARLPQLIAVSGRRAGVIGLKRRRMSRHAVPCGRADSDPYADRTATRRQAHDRCGAERRFGRRSGERESARAHGRRCGPTGTSGAVVAKTVIDLAKRRTGAHSSSAPSRGS
jgi:hypothetical protein